MLNFNGLASWLTSKFGPFFVNVTKPVMEPQDWTDLNKEWERFAVEINEGRKMGIENRGLSLLLAYALQSYFDNVGQELEAA